MENLPLLKTWCLPGRLNDTSNLIKIVTLFKQFKNKKQKVDLRCCRRGLRGAVAAARSALGPIAPAEATQTGRETRRGAGQPLLEIAPHPDIRVLPSPEIPLGPHSTSHIPTTYPFSPAGPPALKERDTSASVPSAGPSACWSLPGAQMTDPATPLTPLCPALPTRRWLKTGGGLPAPLGWSWRLPSRQSGSPSPYPLIRAGLVTHSDPQKARTQCGGAGCPWRPPLSQNQASQGQGAGEDHCCHQPSD